MVEWKFRFQENPKITFGFFTLSNIPHTSVRHSLLDYAEKSNEAIERWVHEKSTSCTCSICYVFSCLVELKKEENDWYISHAVVIVTNPHSFVFWRQNFSPRTHMSKSILAKRISGKYEICNIMNYYGSVIVGGQVKWQQTHSVASTENSFFIFSISLGAASDLAKASCWWRLETW